MVGPQLPTALSGAVLTQVIYVSLAYSFRNCIEDPASNHTSFKCAKRASRSIFEIVGDVWPSAINLSISHCKLPFLPEKSFSHLQMLTLLTLDNNNIKDVDRNAFSDLPQLQTLNLSSNDIRFFKHSVFQSLHKLTSLSVSDNKLTSISQNLFSNLTSLRTLILRRNILNDFSAVVQAVTNLSLLTTLDLSDNNLTSIRHNATLPPSLATLYLGNNRLSTLGCDSTFLSTVRVLDLSYQSLTSREFRDLDLGQVTYLRLRFTKVCVEELLKVSNIRANHIDFSGLGLDRNKLMKLCKYLKSKTNETQKMVLKKMILQYNAIESLSNISQCPAVVGEMDLSHNKLNTTDCLQFLGEQTYLQSLKVEHNHLTKLNSCNRLNKFPALTNLSYRYNRILQVNAFAFIPTPNLTTLQLNINIIAYLDPKALSGLQNLRTLRLDNNLLTDLYNESFEDLKNLQTLNLRNNEIAVIFNRTFHNLHQLTILDLGGNKISQLKPLAFTGLYRLTNLYLDRNRLKEIDSQLFGRLSFTLQVLDLQANHIQFYKENVNSPFLNLTKLLDLKLDSQMPYGLIVVPRAFFRGLISLKRLYLTNNHISSFAADAFDDLVSLEFLTMDNSGAGVTEFIPGIFKNLRKLRIMCVENMGIRSFSTGVFGNLTSLQVVHLNRNAMQSLDLSLLENMTHLRYLDLRNSPLSCSCRNSELQNWTNNSQMVQLIYLYSLTCPDLPGSKFHNFDTKVCYQDIGVYLFASTYTTALLLTILPLLYMKFYWKFKYSYYVFRSWFGEQWRRLREEEEDCKFDAFISYNSADESWVLDQLVPELEGNGSPLRLCLHHRDFELGRDIIDNIVTAVYSSRKTVCVVSQHFLRSEWCSLEIQLASYRLFDELRDVLLLVFLEPISDRQLSAYHRMRMVMQRKTYLQWPGPECAEQEMAQKLFWSQLRGALHSTSKAHEEVGETEETEEERRESFEDHCHLMP